MKIEEFWIVHDPSSVSEIDDICFKTDIIGLAQQVRGGFDPLGVHTGAVIYTEEYEARTDARRRMEARASYDTALAYARGDLIDEE